MTILLLTLLIVKHFIADFVQQTEEHVKEKGYYGKWGGIEHASIHAAWTWLILIFFLFPQPYWILPIVVTEGILHYHIDWFKMKWGRTVQPTPTPNDRVYWIAIGLDQLAHYICYLTIAATVVYILQ